FLNVGMFFERWMIVAPTLSMSHTPHQWDVMWGSVVEWAIVFGSFGWFGLLFLVFVKVFPSVSMYEVKEMVYHRRRHLVNDDAAEKFHRRASDSKTGTDEPGLEGA
ncbi:MAG: hypothetical protein PVF82_11720, partial [Gammaproteobacteria bacterium]